MDTGDLGIGIILGSTRPRRRGASVAAWVAELASTRDARYSLIDLADQGLPLLDEPESPAKGDYVHAHTRAWADLIAPLDGFVFVTPEYNHSYPAALKNAIDFLWAEWNDKAAGIVSYGNAGGTRAAEHLRGVLSAVGIVHVRRHVTLDNRADFDGYEARPVDHHDRALAGLLADIEHHALAMREVRAAR
jgi:NAD(P)H-dependent FMN reductase